MTYNKEQIYRINEVLVSFILTVLLLLISPLEFFIFFSIIAFSLHSSYSFSYSEFNNIFLIFFLTVFHIVFLTVFPIV